MPDERCPFCRTDISHEIPDARFPELCKKCADKEVKKLMKTRGTKPDQTTFDSIKH